MSCGDHKLNDSDRLIRHCPKKFKDGDAISVKVFWFSESELEEDSPYLSFSWLEMICRYAGIPIDCNVAIDELENDFPRDIKKGERWLILSCERIRAAILGVPECDPKICYLPEEDYPSHVGVSGYKKCLHIKVASKLLKEVRHDNMYPVTRTIKRRRK